MRAEQLNGPVEILNAHRQAPEAGGMVRAARTLDRVLGLLNQLKDLGAETKERLTRRAGGSGLVANPAQVKARALKRGDAALQRRRGRNDVIDRDDAVGVGGRERSWQMLGYGRREPVELCAGEIAQRPAEDASPAAVATKKPQSHPADLTAPT